MKIKGNRIAYKFETNAGQTKIKLNRFAYYMILCI